MKWVMVLFLSFFGVQVFANSKDINIRTNEVYMHNAPKWLNRVRVERVTDRIQHQLEWSTRRIHVYWYSSQKDFEKVHNLGPVPIAVARKSNKEQSIHLGPKVGKKNFDQTFGHELVHIIFFQKYRGSIPEWLEEGLANHLARKRSVNYSWLAKQEFPEDVRKLTHPYQKSKARIRYHYVASQAMAEMLDKKCKLENLIRLSVQRKMENYIKSFCEIKDINQAFRSWVKTKADALQPPENS